MEYLKLAPPGIPVQPEPSCIHGGAGVCLGDQNLQGSPRDRVTPRESYPCSLKTPLSRPSPVSDLPRARLGAKVPPVFPKPEFLCDIFEVKFTRWDTPRTPLMVSFGPMTPFLSRPLAIRSFATLGCGVSRLGGCHTPKTIAIPSLTVPVTNCYTPANLYRKLGDRQTARRGLSYPPANTLSAASAAVPTGYRSGLSCAINPAASQWLARVAIPRLFPSGKIILWQTIAKYLLAFPVPIP